MTLEEKLQPEGICTFLSAISWIAIVVPGEGIVKAISEASGKRFGHVKVVFDMSSVGIAVLLSYLFFSGLKGLGIGTVISALTIGRFVDRFNRFLPFIIYIKRLN